MMRIRPAPAVCLGSTLLLVGCAGGSAPPAAPPPISPEHVHGPGATTSSSDEAPPMEYSPAAVARGELVYEAICSDCHAMDRSSPSAPSFRHVARHIRMEFSEHDAFVYHVIGYLNSPHAETSVLPARAIERYGLMPSQPLPPELIRDVAAYLWALSEDDRRGGGGEVRRGG